MKVKFFMLVVGKKMLKYEEIDDIDLSTNLMPDEVINVLTRMELNILRVENMEQYQNR